MIEQAIRPKPGPNLLEISQAARHQAATYLQERGQEAASHTISTVIDLLTSKGQRFPCETVHRDIGVVPHNAYIFPYLLDPVIIHQGRFSVHGKILRRVYKNDETSSEEGLVTVHDESTGSRQPVFTVRRENGEKDFIRVDGREVSDPYAQFRNLWLVRNLRRSLENPEQR